MIRPFDLSPPDSRGGLGEQRGGKPDTPVLHARATGTRLSQGARAPGRPGSTGSSWHLPAHMSLRGAAVTSEDGR